MPTGVTASIAGSGVALTQMALTTGDASSAYVIEAGSDLGMTGLAGTSAWNTATTYEAAGIGSGSCYVRVRAASAIGNGTASNEGVLVVR